MKYLCDPDINYFVYIILLFIILRSCNAISIGDMFTFSPTTHMIPLYSPACPTLVICIILYSGSAIGFEIMPLYGFDLYLHSDWIISYVSLMQHSAWHEPLKTEIIHFGS